MAHHPYYPEVLVPCDEVALAVARGARLVEVDLDPAAYEHGHIPGAIRWDWSAQLRNQGTEEILNVAEFESLMGVSGISKDTEVLLYGDNNNWFACWAFWLMQLYGHENVKLVDGGSKKWLRDQRALSLEPTAVSRSTYKSRGLDVTNKASIEDIFASFFNPSDSRLVDVRSSAEYIGQISGPGDGAGATCEVAGHIPTAINIPWNLNCNEDATFKSPDELRSLYASFDIRPEMCVITYCAIGERASLSWFVLKHLLGYRVVMNYDRSMAQWGRLANSAVVTGKAA